MGCGARDGAPLIIDAVRVWAADICKHCNGAEISSIHGRDGHRHGECARTCVQISVSGGGRELRPLTGDVGCDAVVGPCDGLDTPREKRSQQPYRERRRVARCEDHAGGCW